MHKFTEADLDFVNKALRGVGNFSRYLSKQTATIESVESDYDSIVIGGYTICRYMDKETRRSVRGPFQVDVELFKVTVETESGGTRWDPPDHDYVEIDTCKSLGDALLAVICAEVRAHIEAQWQADAEAEAQREVHRYYEALDKARALIDAPC